MKKMLLGLLLTGSAFASDYLLSFSQNGNVVNFSCVNTQCSGQTVIYQGAYPWLYYNDYGTFFIKENFLFGYGNGNVYLGAGSSVQNLSLKGRVLGGVIKTGSNVKSVYVSVDNNGNLTAYDGQTSYTGTVNGDTINISSCTIKYRYAEDDIFVGSGTNCDMSFILKQGRQVNAAGDYMVYVWTSQLSGPWVYKLSIDTSNGWKLYSCYGSSCTRLVSQGNFADCNLTNLQGCKYIPNMNLYILPGDSVGDFIIGGGSYALLGYKTAVINDGGDNNNGGGNTGGGDDNTGGGNTGGGNTGGDNGSVNELLSAIIDRLNALIDGLLNALTQLINTLSQLIANLTQGSGGDTGAGNGDNSGGGDSGNGNSGSGP